jgi:hypothetical protein
MWYQLYAIGAFGQLVEMGDTMSGILVSQYLDKRRSVITAIVTVLLVVCGIALPSSAAYADDDVSDNSVAPYPNYDSSATYVSLYGVTDTYHVNAPTSERVNVLDEIANGKIPRGNYVFAKNDEQALAKGFDVRTGSTDAIDNTSIVTEDNTTLRKLLLATNESNMLPFYVRHTEIVPAGDEPSVEGVSRYVVDENLSFVAPGEGSSTSAPGSFISMGNTNLSPSYTFDSTTEKGAELTKNYLDATGTATVFMMPVDEDNGDGTTTRRWYWCANPTSAVPLRYNTYVELPLELSPQAQYDSGKEVMYLMNTVLQNAGLNDTNTDAENDWLHSNRKGLPNLKVAYQALRDEYIKVLQSEGSTEPSALDPNVTYGELYEELSTLVNGGTIADGTIYEQTITAQSDASTALSASAMPDLSETGYWEAAHVSVLGIEYAFLSYIQGWPMDGMDVFQGGSNSMTSGFTADDTRTYGARAMARLLVAHAEAARDNGLLDSVTANATFDLTTNSITRANGTTTVTVSPDTSNASSLSLKVPSGVTVVSMTKDGASVSATTSTDENGATTYTFSDSASFPDSITLSTATTNEKALRDDVLFTVVGATKTVAKAYVNSNDLYQDEATGHWVVREFVRAINPMSESSSTDSNTIGQELSQTVFKFTPEYQTLHARINLTETHEVEFSKVDVGGTELSGASIQILDSDGDTVESWTSDGTTHTVSLEEGTYTFHEVSAPSGYTAVTDITFTVGSDGTVAVANANGNTVSASGNTLTVTDQASGTETHEVEFSKVNVGGEELSGASIQILDSDGATVESWTSDGTTHTVSLEEGTYTFHETSAPDGYEAVTDITFTVGSDGTVAVANANGNTVVASGSTLTVTDQATTYNVDFSKVDVGGEELSGASIQILDSDGNVAASWISAGETETVNLAAGTYTFRETAAPDGYEAVTDITFTIDSEGSVTVDSANGNTVVASGSTLTVTDQASTYDIDFSKVNVGGEELSGAEIQVLDSDGDVVDSWTSTGTTHTTSLTAGTYTFQETAAPDGYEAVTDITFTVSTDGTVTVTNANGNTVVASGSTLTVTDQASETETHEVEFSKVNVGGEEIGGAEIQIKDSDGNVVDSWTSEAGKNHTTSLAEGTYTFHEESAPDGYEAVTDITFTVNADGTVTVVDAAGNTVEADGTTLIVTDQTTDVPDTSSGTNGSNDSNDSDSSNGSSNGAASFARTGDSSTALIVALAALIGASATVIAICRSRRRNER